MEQFNFFGDRTEKLLDFLEPMVGPGPVEKYRGRTVVLRLTEYKPSRTRKQENYYRKCCRIVGQEIGYDPDDIHEIVLATTWGSEVREVFGQKKRVPLKRSADSKNPKEYAELTETLARLAAEYAGFVLPTPEELENYT